MKINNAIIVGFDQKEVTIFLNPETGLIDKVSGIIEMLR